MLLCCCYCDNERRREDTLLPSVAHSAQCSPLPHRFLLLQQHLLLLFLSSVSVCLTDWTKVRIKASRIRTEPNSQHRATWTQLSFISSGVESESSSPVPMPLCRSYLLHPPVLFCSLFYQQRRSKDRCRVCAREECFSVFPPHRRRRRWLDGAANRI